jgi:hypothetical protein
VPALLYGFFACYAVTGKCELRTDSQGRDLAVFNSLEECQRFGSGPAQQPPNSEGKWVVADGHYFQCLSMTPGKVPAAATAPAAAGAAAAAAVPLVTAAPPAVAAPAAAGVTAAAAAQPAAAAATGAVPPAASATPATAANAGTAALPAAAAVTAAATAKAAATAAPAAAIGPPTATAAAPAAAVPRPDAARPVYRTTAQALQHDFEINPQALNQKIGNAVVEVSGTVVNRARLGNGELQLSGGRSDVTAWLRDDEIGPARALSKRAIVTLSCDRIGTLVAASARRPGVVEVRDCRFLDPGG